MNAERSPATSPSSLPRTGALRATLRYTSKGRRDEIIRTILEACGDDVFVALSPRKRNADRIKQRGRTIAGDDELFERFVLESFKLDERSATSDE